MDKQNLMPQAAQPVNRLTTGQLPELAELSEEALQQHECDAAAVSAASSTGWPNYCSYDGDDAE